MRRKQRCVSEIKSKIDNNKVALVPLIEKETAIVKWELLAQHMIVDVHSVSTHRAEFSSAERCTSAGECANALPLCGTRNYLQGCLRRHSERLVLLA